jgi:hypothetical protein
MIQMYLKQNWEFRSIHVDNNGYIRVYIYIYIYIYILRNNTTPKTPEYTAQTNVSGPMGTGGYFPGGKAAGA